MPWKHVHFLRGQKRGRDKGPEKGLFGKTCPRKLIYFPNNLENLVFLKKWDFDQIHISNLIFTESQHGPEGPYEPLLWDITSNKWPKNRVFDESSLFGKWPCPFFLENAIFGGEKATAGWFHSKTKVVNTSKIIPDPNRTKLYLEIATFNIWQI